jgi:DNA-binding NarL/FixJ family response regulator
MPEQITPESKPLIKVLLVEDHALTRMGLKAAFKRTSDISVIGEAANGEEAIEQARLLSPDVIVMDVGMPVMDGIQAAKVIVTNHPQIKIVMLTQHDNDSDILASLAAGASGYCLKDVEPERLYTAVRSVNAGDAWLDATIASRVLRHYSTLPKTSVVASTTKETPVELEVADLPASQTFDRPAPDALSPRELEVLKLIVDGLSNQEIADRLIISLATAKTHVRNILNKLAVDDRTQAAVHAMRRRLV